MKNNVSSVSVNSFKGIPIVNYNRIVEKNCSKIEIDGKIYDGFYVSYNSYDIGIYGDVTTALVLGQMQKFYILNGNHSEEYKKIIKDGFEKCLEYFNKNISQINKYSDLIMEIETGRIATIEYGSYHSAVYCVKFNDGKRFQISETDLKNKFKKVNAICPKCGHKLVKSDLEEYKFLCETCDENFYGIEVRQYI